MVEASCLMHRVPVPETEGARRPRGSTRSEDRVVNGCRASENYNESRHNRPGALPGRKPLLYSRPRVRPREEAKEFFRAAVESKREGRRSEREWRQKRPKQRLNRALRS